MKQRKKWLLFSQEDHWVRPYFKAYRPLLILALTLGLLTFFSASALMFTSGYLISKSARQPYNILLVYVPIVLTRAFGIGRPTFRYLERLVSHNWVLKMTSDLRVRLYQLLAERDDEGLQSGNLLGILMEDIEHIQNLYLRTIFPTLISWGLYALILLGSGLFSIPLLFMLLVLLGALIFVIPLWSLLWRQALIYQRKEKRHVLYKQLTDAVLGVGDWQYSGRSQDFLTHYETLEKAVWQDDQKIQKGIRFQQLISQFVFLGVVLSVLMWASHYFYGTGSEGLNWIAAFVLCLFPLMDAFGPLSQGVMELPMYETTVNRLTDLDQLPKRTLSERSSMTLNDYTIICDQVSFRYKDMERAILDQFSLKVQEGEILAILGKSGTGKTTLINLIQGLYTPDSGKITIGGYAAQDIMEQAHNIFSVLSQDPHLFDTSIFNNIRLGRPTASEAEVYDAAVQAGLKSLIDELPEGIHTLVEEGGKRFSGGEQQRIALARILLQDAPIVILDEPTVGLDPITEQKLLTTVFEVLSEKTILWITHHLMEIGRADRIIFLEYGMIEMNGTPKELLATSSRFQKLYALDHAGMIPSYKEDHK